MALSYICSGMPSFTRRLAASTPAPPAGTTSAPSTSRPLLPTGVPSLDDLFAGGVPLGATWLVLAPDTHSAWGRLLARYWIAQGLISGQDSIVLDGIELPRSKAEDEDRVGRELVKGCMWVDERDARAAGTGAGGEGAGAASESEGEDAGMGEGKGGKKIAWRYDGMSKFKTTVGGSNSLNLTKTIPASTVREAESSVRLQYLPAQRGSAQSVTALSVASSSASQWPRLQTVLTDLQTKLSESTKSNKAVRVLVNEIGGIEWGDPSSQELHRFLLALRSILRASTASVLVTLPASLSVSPAHGWSGTREEWVKSLAWNVDACVELRGFSDQPALQRVYAPLHGLLTLHSFPTSHALLSPTIRHSTLLGLSSASGDSSATGGSGSGGGGGGGGAGENNLGFRCGRKRWVVETVHLGIEGGTGERRTEAPKDVEGIVGGDRPHTAPGSGSIAKDSSGVFTHLEAEGIETAKPTGTKKKVRARVRFGDDEDDAGAGPSAVVEVGRDTGAQHADSHGHDHDHSHSPSATNTHQHEPPPRVGIRHDKPELYDF